jgi:protein-tyrosine-phosphatase
MAAGLAQKMLQGHVQVESAGIAPFGSSAAQGTLHVLGQEGIDLSDHRPRDVTDVSLDEFDWVISLDTHVDSYLKKYCQIDRTKLIAWKIDDPYGQDMEAYARCLQSIRSRIEDLLAQLGLPSAESECR